MSDLSRQIRLLNEYAKSHDGYEKLSSTAANLLDLLLKREGIQVHSVTHRCKSTESLAAKIARPEKDYEKLDQVTDLAGVRVTTYFADDVDRVAAIVEREFQIDLANSIDKRTITDPDRFGYQSLHYVASFTAARISFSEYSQFNGLKLEIQIRSVLQHAWAEIEHDLGYKTSGGVPREIRRRFARVAGLLEIADVEFNALREALRTYEVDVPKQIALHPEDVKINALSLRSAYTSSETLKQLDSVVAQAAGAAIDSNGVHLLERAAARLESLGVKTIAELEKVSFDRLPLVREFAKHWLKGTQHAALTIGIGLFYLCYVLLGESQDIAKVRSHLEENGIVSNEKDDIAERVLQTFSTARENVHCDI